MPRRVTGGAFWISGSIILHPDRAPDLFETFPRRRLPVGLLLGDRPVCLALLGQFRAALRGGVPAFDLVADVLERRHTGLVVVARRRRPRGVPRPGLR